MTSSEHRPEDGALQSGKNEYGGASPVVALAADFENVGAQTVSFGGELESTCHDGALGSGDFSRRG